MTRFIDSYLLYLLAQASAKASAGFHAQLADQGVPVSTWRILATLHPDASAGISELANACLAKQPTMTRQIDRLVAAGLVTRTHASTDRRRVTVCLTEQGRALSDRLTSLARDHEAKTLAAHDPEQITRFKAMLSTLLTVPGNSG